MVLTLVPRPEEQVYRDLPDKPLNQPADVQEYYRLRGAYGHLSAHKEYRTELSKLS
jgi:hypothetical protein